MRYILGVLGVILVLIVVIVLIFNRGDDNTPATNGTNSVKIVDYAAKNSTVSVTTEGHLVGDELHNSIRIVVSGGERRLEILNGYDNNVVSTQTYPNTTAAYEAFLSALGGQGFQSSKKTSITDKRSVCPTGEHYEYDLSENGASVTNLWGASCDKGLGTFAGQGPTIRQLFQAQIPDYATQTGKVEL